MPETIEISTKLIALITAIIAFISTIIAFRKKKNDGSDNTSPTKMKKGIDADVWEMFRFFAGFIAFGFLLLGTLIGFKWLLLVFASIK
jgi:hypothetical protein